MRFEHLVQINDPLQPLLAEVSRRQLWHGLIRRAESPSEFVLGLAKATIHERDEHDGVVELTRTLDFGNLLVQDRIRLTADQSSVTHTEGSSNYPPSRMTIRIEEPAPGNLFLRFIYESDEVAGTAALDTVAESLRRQAYQSADIDTVWRIRDLVERGGLD